MQPARRLREKIARHELVTGILVTDHLWIDLVEIAQRGELDYLIVDMEHGPAASDLAADVCAAGRRMGFPVLIRPRANDYATLRLAMDLGPCGFLLAGVDSASELDVVQEAIFLPPRGRRRPGGVGNRWVASLTQEVWKQTVEDLFIVLPQIETRAGLEQAAEIANHPLTTALAVGPYDLSVDLQVSAQMRHPRLIEALQKLRETATAAGKSMWMIGNDIEQLVADGWRLLCIGEPSWILQTELQRRVAAGRRMIKADSQERSDAK